MALESRDAGQTQPADLVLCVLRSNNSSLWRDGSKLKTFINEHLGEFLEAMADNVVGLKHLMMRDPKTGKFERLTDVKQIDKALKSKNACWIYTKDPNVQAFTDLW